MTDDTRHVTVKFFGNLTYLPINVRKSFGRSLDMLKENPQYGIHIPKRLIPLVYIKRYFVNNLWKCNLAEGWRLIYWIDGTCENLIIVFIVDILSHKEYERIFHY